LPVGAWFFRGNDGLPRLFKRPRTGFFMLPIQNTVFYLSKVSYLEEKRLVVVEFSNNSSKRSESFLFFPSALVPSSNSTEPIIRQLLNSFDRKKFKVEKRNDCTLAVFARSFSDLKRFCTLLEATLKTRALLVEPERQFLLSRNWSFFDAFDFSCGAPEKKDYFSLPKLRFDWMNAVLEKEIAVLLKSEREVAEKILESIVLSNALCVPLNGLPQQQPLLAELFLEAACYKNSFVFPRETGNVFSGNRFGFFNGNQEDFAELDFSKVWPTLFGFPFFNLSFDTIDCDCCVPETAFEQNILPSSKVEVRFKKNGLFFESKTENFARQFHEICAGKESRLQRQKEFFLQSPPIGPFDAGDKAVVPVSDALELCSSASAEITNNAADLHWFCRKQDGLLSKEFSALDKKIVSASASLEEKRLLALKRFGVFAENHLFCNAEAMFLHQAIQALSRLLESIPVHLLSPSSRFYYKQLAMAFIAIQSIMLKNFRQLGNSLGAKAVPVGSGKCLLSSNHALSVSKEFSRTQRLPAPAIR